MCCALGILVDRNFIYGILPKTNREKQTKMKKSRKKNKTVLTKSVFDKIDFSFFCNSKTNPL